MLNLKDILEDIEKRPEADLEAIQAAVSVAINARKDNPGEIIEIAPSTEAINL